MSVSTVSPPIRIVIVDDQITVREALKVLLELQPDFKVVGIATLGEEAISLIRDLQTDIALIDVDMPGMTGIEVTAILSQQCLHTKVVILSSHASGDYLLDSLHAGAKGYLLKNTAPEDLAKTIRLVQKGYSLMSPGLIQKVLHRIPSSSSSPGSNDQRLALETFDLDMELGLLEVAINSDPVAIDYSATLVETSQPLSVSLNYLEVFRQETDRLAHSIQQLSQGFEKINALLGSDRS
ncbi:MAG: hypothetical protein RLZZ435_846 [Cyanobacteriota bacterium]